MLLPAAKYWFTSRAKYRFPGRAGLRGADTFVLFQLSLIFPFPMKAFLTLALALTAALAAQAQLRPARPTTPEQLLRRVAPLAPATAARGTTATVLRPGQAVRYAYNSANQTWVDPERDIFRYDAQGRRIQETTGDSATSRNYDQTFTTYTPAGQVSEIRTQLNVGSAPTTAWEDIFKEVFTYDTNQQLVEHQQLLVLMPGTWTPDSGERYLNTYNSANRLTAQTVQVYRRGPGAYADSLRYLYGLAPNGEWTTRVTQEPNGSGGWNNLERQYGAVWHNYGRQQLSSAKAQEWTGTRWQTVARVLGTYTATSAETIAQDSVAGGGWDNAQRDFVRFDAYDNLLNASIESWTGTAWNVVIEVRYAYAYNPDQSLRRSVLSADFGGSGLQLRAKVNYSNYQTIVLGRRAAALAAGTVQAYPNPSPDGRFTLLLSAPAATGEICVFDALGRQVARDAWAGAPRTTCALSLAGQPAGLYTVRVQTAAGRITQRVGIQ